RTGVPESLTCLFFFQAEDGIRDFHVTGVQTCALPISTARLFPTICWRPSFSNTRRGPLQTRGCRSRACWSLPTVERSSWMRSTRSEERRVGKGCRLRTEAGHERKREIRRARREDSQPW